MRFGRLCFSGFCWLPCPSLIDYYEPWFVVLLPIIFIDLEHCFDMHYVLWLSCFASCPISPFDSKCQSITVLRKKERKSIHKQINITFFPCGPILSLMATSITSIASAEADLLHVQRSFHQCALQVHWRRVWRGPQCTGRWPKTRGDPTQGCNGIGCVMGAGGC